MIKHLLKKLVILCTSLFVVVTLTFFLTHAIPGDPFSDEEAIPEEILKALYQHYGLDQPLYVQFGKYFNNLLHGNLGISFKYHGRTANDVIGEGFPISLTLGFEALLLAIGLGILLGSYAAVKRGKWQDQTTMLLAVLGISVPSFILATLLQYVFAMQLDWFPVARWGSFAQSVLPALSLAALPTAMIARLTRASMVEVLQQDYILMARSKGLNSFQIIYRHALRNALLPVVTYLGPLTANVLTGSFVVEKIFGIPGLGQWFVMSVANRDYTLIMSLTIFYSAFLMVCVFIVDIIYSLLDPRIKIGKV
ncbi:MAG: ABC transporter permease [Verrucomicrobia bacterium]|nr:ABC transporter permease [Verrucomicrobiota bacterium]